MRDLADELLQAKVKARLFGGDHAPRLGRLVILDKLGAGAMGTVFSAYDPRLDRKIAVKVMHATDAAARARVLREARALARLAHPNIVTIHDAGEDDGTVHVVMELATGVPLRVWIDNPERTWRDVVRVMTDVAAGLAAAHAANIIHRDIKPENILVGADRARLVDFGLALDPQRPAMPSRAPAPIKSSASRERPRVSDPSVNTVDLTGTDAAPVGHRISDPFLATVDLSKPEATGNSGPATDPDAEPPRDMAAHAATDLASLDDHAAGTPSYMAPEVLAGGLATPASDQFSFAVTLFEALHGERSHTGSTRAELHAAALRAAAPTRSRHSQFPEDGVRTPDVRRKKSPEASADQTQLSVTEPPRPTSSTRPAKPVGAVPAWVDAIVRRALAPNPEGRFASMAALHAELVRDRTRRRRAIAIALAALVIGGVAGVLVYRARGGGEVTVVEQVSCDAQPRIDQVWSARAQGRVREALGNTTWASSTFDGLGRNVAAWHASFRIVCEATRVRGEQSDRLLELRMRCLDRALDRFDAFSAALQTPLDQAGRTEAATAVNQLPQPTSCETMLDNPELAVPTDPALRVEATAIERELDHAWAAYALGRYSAARTQTSSLSRRSSKLDLPALHASVLLLAGAVEARIGGARDARQLYEHAVVLAAKAKATELELAILTRILRQELFHGRPQRVVEWGAVGEAAAIRAGHDGAEVSAIIGEALRERGELAEARERFTAALASRDPVREDARAMIEMNLASVDFALGRSETARAAFQRAHDRARAALGDGHPTLAIHLDRLAEAARARGKLTEAFTFHERSIGLRTAAFGDEDRSVATARFHRAETLLEAGRLAEAAIEATTARTLRVKAFGAWSARIAEIEVVFGEIAMSKSKLADAWTHFNSAAKLDDGVNPQRRVVALVMASGVAAIQSPNGPLDRDRFSARMNALGLDKKTLELDVLAKEAAMLDPFSTERAASIAARFSVLPRDRVATLLPSFAAHYRTVAAAGATDAALALPVADALLASGDRPGAAAIYTAAIAALADEPSRARLHAFRGLALAADGDAATAARTTAAALARAMPELR